MICLLRRAAARLVDYLIWGMLAAAVLGDKIGNITAPSLLFYAAFWIYLFVEAFQISFFATTAGKRLLGIYVFDQNGEKLSFLKSFKRAFLVFAVGMGLFLPYISLFFPLCVLVWSVKRKTFFWDLVVPDDVRFLKTTLIDKIVLICFMIFLASGYFATARVAFLYREPDFTSLENSILTPYFEKIRPQMVQALSEESVLSPQAAEQTAKELSEIQQHLQYQREEIILLKDSVQTQFDKMPEGGWKKLRQEQTDLFFEKLDRFLFTESMRVGLFENILDFFKSEERNKYKIIDGRPVFEDPEMMRQYDNYMMQLQIFLTSALPEEV